MLGLVNFLLIYTHYIAGFILLWQAMIVLFLCRKELIRPTIVVTLILIGLGAWRFTAKTIRLLFHHQDGFWLGKPGFYELKTAFYDYFNERNIFLFYSILSAAVLCHILFSRKINELTKEQRIKILYVLLCGITTVFAGFAIGQFVSVFLMRYLLYTSPFMYIAIAWLVSISSPKTKYIAICLIILVSVFSFSRFELRTEKSMNYRDAMAVIKKLESPKTIILVETKDIAPLFTYYYDIAIFKDFYGMQTQMNQRNIFFITTAEDVKAIDMKRYDKVILTQSFDGVNPKNDELLAYLGSTYHKKAEVKYYSEVNILAYTK